MILRNILKKLTQHFIRIFGHDIIVSCLQNCRIIQAPDTDTIGIIRPYLLSVPVVQQRATNPISITVPGKLCDRLM
ncbi:hypothetical protein FQZ97_873020 [compost metagenome]